MTLPMELFSHLQPESGLRQYSQESGEIGFSSTLEHTISEDYDENALPVSGKGSSVKVIPKEEAEFFESTESLGQLFSKPKSVEEFPEPSTKPLINKSTTATTTAKATTSALGAGNPDKEMMKASPGKTAIMRGAAHEVSGNCGIMGKIKDLKGASKCRKVTQKRKRPAAARKINIPKWFRLIWMASLVPVSDGFPGSTKPKSFTCMDWEKCQHLVSIYNKKDFCLYVRDLNDPFPACSDPHKPIGNNSCFVCNDTSKICIYCPVEDLEQLEVEGGGHSLNISSGCVPSQTPCQEHVGCIIASVLTPTVVMLLVGVLIYYFCHKRRAEGPQRNIV